MTQVLAVTTTLFRDRDLFVHDGSRLRRFRVSAPIQALFFVVAARRSSPGPAIATAQLFPARRPISPAFQPRPKPGPARSSSARR